MRYVFFLLAPLFVLAAACGGDSESPAEATARAAAQATLDAQIARAEELGVTEETLAYARQFCEPIRSVFDDFLALAPVFEAADDTEDFTTLVEAMEQLRGPLERLVGDMSDIDPPASYQEYHEGLLAEFEFALEAIDLIEQGGFFALFALGDEPPSVEEPPELESALAIECGAEFLEILQSESLGEFDFFGSGEADEPAPTGPGSSRSNPVPLGSSVRVGDDLEMRVTEVNFDAWPVIQEETQFNDPPAPGNRMTLISIEVTNVGTGDESTFVSDGRFSLTGSRNVVYNIYDDDVYCGFIPDRIGGEFFPGGTLRGNVCFQYPEDETNLVLIAEPAFSFGSSERRYLALE